MFFQFIQASDRSRIIAVIPDSATVVAERDGRQLYRAGNRIAGGGCGIQQCDQRQWDADVDADGDRRR